MILIGGMVEVSVQDEGLGIPADALPHLFRNFYRVDTPDRQAIKGTGLGLAIVDAPNGSIVAYSTAPGTEALDGIGDHSPYTAAFLRLAHEKNLPIEQLFKRVRLDVNNATEGRQTPWESSSPT